MRHIVIAVLFAAVLSGWSQGSFQNLDFESPILPLTPVFSEVSITKAMPGWTGYLGANQTDRTFYNTISIGGAAISFHSMASSLTPIQGSYSLILQPSSAGPPTTVALGQTGQIPGGVQSLQFFSSPFSAFQVTFAGQAIPLVRIGGNPRYDILGGDISAFSGITGELRFTGGGMLDNIQFSTQPIPEPSTLCLLGFGALLVSWHWRRKRAV